MDFESLKIRHEILDAVREKGFTAPTAVQEQAIPLLLQGEDLIVQAQTGTGKTAAFAITILETLKYEDASIQALVLVPTRELCMQVTEDIRELGVHLPVRTLAVYGGEDIEKQFRALRGGVHVVIGTPGRVLDHLSRKTISFSHVKTLVLDEADRMLDMGFIDDIEEILRHVPKERQTMLFSATMPLDIVDLAQKHMQSPERIQVGEARTVEAIDQYYAGVDPRDKTSALLALLALKKPGLCLVFARTQRGADSLYESLQRRGIRADVLHGALTQARRDSVMKEFREGRVKLLVATDLAARGLDIEGIDLVVNYNMPDDYLTYQHRVGRTGRAGRTGESVTFTTSVFETKELRKIAQATGSDIKPLELEYSRAPPRSFEETRAHHARGGRSVPYAGVPSRGGFQRGPPRGEFHRGGGRPHGGGPHREGGHSSGARPFTHRSDRGRGPRR